MLVTTKKWIGTELKAVGCKNMSNLHNFANYVITLVEYSQDQKMFPSEMFIDLISTNLYIVIHSSIFM